MISHRLPFCLRRECSQSFTPRLITQTFTQSGVAGSLIKKQIFHTWRTETNNAKKLKTNSELSANDVLAKRWTYLKKEIAAMKREFKEINDMFKHRGSFNTRKYMIEVSNKNRLKTPNYEEGLAVFGEVFRLACSEISVTYVNVIKKGGE